MKPITKEEFDILPPFDRGWIVYMCGNRDDQPNVPAESNPYAEGTPERQAWCDGQFRATLSVQDSEE